MVRTELSRVIQDASGSEVVFSSARSGVDVQTIRSGFANACKKLKFRVGKPRPAESRGMT